jgi:hypothetical protein
MGRLAHHQKKQFAVKTFIFIALFVAFILFLGTVGFKLIINGSLFINELANRSRNKSENTANRQTLTSLLVDPPPTATSSSHLIVSGSTVNFDMVEIYLNSEKVTDAFVTGDTFSEEISGLEKGENSLYVIAKSKESDETKRSTKYTVIYKDEKPKLEVTEPGDNSRTNKQEIKVAGKTDKETYIKVNGMPVVVDVQGGFQTLVKLNDGDNTIEVTAEDIVGNTEKKTLKVTYSKDD